MNYQKILRELTGVIACIIVTVLTLTQAAFAQNSPLSVKGDQEKFGNLQVVSQYGHVVFADQPDRETIAMVKDHGISMIINIRGVAEDEGFDERKAALSAGVAYLQIPYMDGRTINADAVEEILGLVDMTGANGTKIMIHCTHSQRAGALLGAALVKAGYSREQANAAAVDAGMTSEFITRIHNDYLDTIE